MHHDNAPFAKAHFNAVLGSSPVQIVLQSNQGHFCPGELNSLKAWSDAFIADPQADLERILRRMADDHYAHDDNQTVDQKLTSSEIRKELKLMSLLFCADGALVVDCSLSIAPDVEHMLYIDSPDGTPCTVRIYKRES